MSSITAYTTTEINKTTYIMWGEDSWRVNHGDILVLVNLRSHFLDVVQVRFLRWMFLCLDTSNEEFFLLLLTIFYFRISSSLLCLSREPIHSSFLHICSIVVLVYFVACVILGVLATIFVKIIAHVNRLVAQEDGWRRCRNDLSAVFVEWVGWVAVDAVRSIGNPSQSRTRHVIVARSLLRVWRS